MWFLHNFPKSILLSTFSVAFLSDNGFNECSLRMDDKFTKSLLPGSNENVDKMIQTHCKYKWVIIFHLKSKSMTKYQHFETTETNAHFAPITASVTNRQREKDRISFVHFLKWFLIMLILLKASFRFVNQFGEFQFNSIAMFSLNLGFYNVSG